MNDHPYDEQAKHYEQRECELLDRIEELEAKLYRKDERIKAWKQSSDEYEAKVEELEARLREEIMESYNDLTSTRQARYSGPEEFADAVLQAEQEGELRNAHFEGYMAGVGDSEDYDHDAIVMEKGAWKEYLADTGQEVSDG